MSDLPTGLTEPTPRLSADWLTERLPPGVSSVSSVEFERIGVFSTELWRANLQYEDASAPGPTSLILKRPISGRRDRAAEGFEYEVRFYRELSGRLPVRTPRLYFGSEDPPSLLLEDVTELEPFHWDASPEHLHAAMEELGRLHVAARDWRDGLDWVPHLADSELLDVFEQRFESGWGRGRGVFTAVVPGFTPIGDALVGRVAASLEPLGGDATLLHGDAYGENIPLIRSVEGKAEVVFLDWAGPLFGNPAFDVAVVLAMSNPVEARRRHERELTELHASVLRSAGVGWANPWADYRLAILRRAIVIVEIAADRFELIEHPGFRFVIERCLTAAVDLETNDLIRGQRR